MTPTKQVNGKKVELSETEITEIVEEEKARKEKQEFYLASAQYVRDQRRGFYPDIADQLDAILKQLNYMQMDGQTDLIQPMDDIITAWLKVKRDHPKPKDKK